MLEVVKVRWVGRIWCTETFGRKFMKRIFHLVTILVIFIQTDANSEETVVGKDRISELSKAGLLDVAYWIKPILTRAEKTHDPHIDQEWMVTIANHSTQPLVINKYWFLHNDWLEIVNEQTSKSVARLSSFPSKEVEKLAIEAKSSVSFKAGGISSFVCFVGSSLDDGVEFRELGTFKVKHRFISKPVLRFSITAEGAISIHHRAMYPKHETKPNKSE